MKNKKKRTILLIGLVVIICLTIGYFIHKNKKENYIETQEERLNLYFKYNLKNYNSMHVTSFRKNPMGAYYISGYVN
ncbi:DUF1433 domain-containing protein, partial [Staphylococcus caprae]